MRTKECSCLKGKDIDFNTEGAFCPICQGYIRPLGQELVEEIIWKSELIKGYINQLSQYAGEGFNLYMNRLKENIEDISNKIFIEKRELVISVLQVLHQDGTLDCNLYQGNDFERLLK